MILPTHYLLKKHLKISTYDHQIYTRLHEKGNISVLEIFSTSSHLKNGTVTPNT